MTSEHNGGGGGCGVELSAVRHQPADSTSKRNLVVQAAPVFFKGALKGVTRMAYKRSKRSLSAIVEEQADTKCQHTWAAREKKLVSGGPQEAAKCLFTWPQEDEASDLQESFWARAGSFGEWESGFASGVRSNFRKTRGESVIGACPRSSWWRWEDPPENSLADSRWHSTKTFEVRLGGNNNMEKLKTTTFIELTRNFYYIQSSPTPAAPPVARAPLDNL